MTTANSNDEYWVSSPLLEKRNTDWCVFRVIMAHDYSKRTSVKEEQK